jgi:hypothetical protein
MRLNLLPLVSKSRAGRSRLVRETQTSPKDKSRRQRKCCGHVRRGKRDRAIVSSHSETIHSLKTGDFSLATVEIHCEQWQETSRA